MDLDDGEGDDAERGPSPRRRRELTRRLLLAGAVRVFAERGVTGAAVEEICAAAGFTRGAFYSNFADKDELVLALLEAGTEAQLVGERRDAQQLDAGARDAPFGAVAEQAVLGLDTSSVGSRETAQVLSELRLHVSRAPSLRAGYATYVRQRNRRLATRLSAASAYADVELVVPLDRAVDLLLAAARWDQERTTTDGATGATALRTAVGLLFRPGA